MTITTIDRVLLIIQPILPFIIYYIAPLLEKFLDYVEYKLLKWKK